MSDPLSYFRVKYLQLITRVWATKYTINKEGKPVPDFNEQTAETNFKKLCEQADINLPFVYPWDGAIAELTYNKKTKWQHNWFGPDDELVIYLPPRPPKDSRIKPEEKSDFLRAKANYLTRYYERFPTLWGRDRQTEVETGLQGQVSASESSGGVGPLKQGLGTEESFLEFGALMLRVIALTWNSDFDLLEELCNEKRDASYLLSQYFGYNNPWNFRLVIQPPEIGTKVLETIKEIDEFDFDDCEPNKIVLNFPNPPEDLNDWPSAIAAYNQTGPEYPFTCI